MSTTTYDYRYYIEGRYLAILQRSISSTYDPYLTLSEDLYTTPAAADANAIYLRHTVACALPSSEESDIGVSGLLAQAMIYYVKSKLYEDAGDEKRAFVARNKFYELIQREMNSRKGGMRKIMSHGVEVLK